MLTCEVRQAYSQEAIIALQANPNVFSVNESRIQLTYEFKLKLYEMWEQKPGQNTISLGLESAGLGPDLVGIHFAERVHNGFRIYGRPRNGLHSQASKGDVLPKEEAEQRLLASGKFIKMSHGIGITDEFEQELLAHFPEQSVEDGLRSAGIDPAWLGARRLYKLNDRLMSKYKETRSGSADSADSGQCTPSAGECGGKRSEATGIGASPETEDPSSSENGNAAYPVELVPVMNSHLYVRRASVFLLSLRDEFYGEAAPLVQNGISIDEILNMYELPSEWFTPFRLNNLSYKLNHTSWSSSGKGTLLDRCTSDEQQRQYLRIQERRMAALQKIASQGFETIREHWRSLSDSGKIQLCEWLRDDVPHEQRGEYSLSGILEKIGMCRSHYYQILSDSFAAAAAEKANRKKEDMDAVRMVAEYRGYPKGSRQIYMQMGKIAHTHMGRSKIIRIMHELDYHCNVRGPNPARQRSQKFLQTHVKPNLLKRRFRLHRPGEVFLTDVTYLKHGKDRNLLTYGSAAIDAVTGRVVSFYTSKTNDLPFVLETLKSLPRLEDGRAILQPMLHSDQGALYLTDEFQELCRELGFTQSMSKRGNCWDNGPCESFFGHFKDECPYEDSEDDDELDELITEYLVYFNEIRGQWTRNKMSPVDFEAYILNMSEEEFQAWQAAEEQKYLKMKEQAKIKAIERAKTLGV